MSKSDTSYLAGLSVGLAAVFWTSSVLAQPVAPPGSGANAPSTTPTVDDGVVARPRVSAEATRFERTLDRELGVAGGLTADQVAERAVVTSFDIAARRAEVAAAAAEVDRALLGYLPSVTLLARYTRLSDPGDVSAGSVVSAPGAPAGPLAPGTPLSNVPLSFPVLLNQYTFQASLLVPVSDYFLRVAPARSAAESMERSAEAEVKAARQRTDTDARVAYYAWTRARLGVLVAQQAVEQAKGHLGDAQRALEVGTASPADVLRLESQVAQSELLLQSSKNLSALTEEQLRVVMHDTRDKPYSIGEDIRRPAELPPHRSAKELWTRALAQRPEVVALEHREQAAGASARTERASYLPRFELFANAYYTNPNPRVFPQRDAFAANWDAGAQLTWVLTDIPRAGANSRAADARTRTIAAERSALLDRVRIEVVAAYQDLEEAKLAVDTATRRLVAAEESYRVRRVLFQSGRATSVELLDAETDLTRARLEAVHARVDVRVAGVRLRYAIGSVPVGGAG